jgi:CDGSH-type Zn-finger protein
MERIDEKDSSAIIEVIDGGPLKVSGKVVLRDLKKDITESPSETLLCRCGRSGHKPYCDESHKRN